MTDFENATNVIRNIVGIPFIMHEHNLDANRVLVAYTDANRNHKNLEKHSGLGGFVVFDGYLKYWHYRLPRHVVRLVPVHVT